MAYLSVSGHRFDVSCIVFDKDGTLLDFDGTWGPRTSSWIRALAKLAPDGKEHFEYFSGAIGYNWTEQRVIPDGPITVTTAQKLITLTAGALYQLGLPWHTSENLAIQAFRQEMAIPLRASELRALGDVAGTMDRLEKASFTLAIVTGDDREPTLSCLTLLGIRDHFSVIVCGDDSLAEKPDPAALLHIGRETGVPTQQMLMVGDTVNDMLTGRNAPVAGCIGITGSTGDPSKLAPYADVMATSIEDLVIS